MVLFGRRYHTSTWPDPGVDVGEGPDPGVDVGE
jgi:hypothetical protein